MSTYYIKDLESITGIKAHTIRIWEHRYNLITPQRTETNIRFYNDEDVKLLLNISLLNKRGLKISKISTLSKSEIHTEALLTCKRKHQNDDLINSLILATYNVNEAAINRIFGQYIMEFGFENAIINLAFPFLQRLGDLWASNALHPALEHFASNIIKKKLQYAIEGIETKTNINKKFLLFLPPGEMHDLGLLFANYVIKKRGHDVLYFGQNTPIDDLYKLNENYHANYILSVFTTCNSLIEPAKLVHELKLNWPNVKIILAGCKMATVPCECFKSEAYKDTVTVLNESCELIIFLDNLEKPN